MLTLDGLKADPGGFGMLTKVLVRVIGAAGGRRLSLAFTELEKGPTGVGLVFGFTKVTFRGMEGEAKEEAAAAVVASVFMITSSEVVAVVTLFQRSRMLRHLAIFALTATGLEAEGSEDLKADEEVALEEARTGMLLLGLLLLLLTVSTVELVVVVVDFKRGVVFGIIGCLTMFSSS